MRIIGKKLKRMEKLIPEYSVTIVGAGCVGKSCLIDRLIKDEFSLSYKPTVSEVYNVSYKRNFKTVANLLLYDTAGSWEFPVMRRLTISKSQACMVVFSVDSFKSFELAKRQIEEVIQVSGKSFPCVLVGSKSDVVEREVSFEKGLRCAVQYSCSYVEVSAKNGVNINQSFDSVLTKIEALEVMRRRVSQSLIKSKSNSTWSLSLKRSSI